MMALVRARVIIWADDGYKFFLKKKASAVVGMRYRHAREKKL
jgi:hypothetical protein